MKIGIITMLYKSINAGGVLQAYALTKWINENGFNCVQINYSMNIGVKKRKNDTKKNRSTLKNIKSIVKGLIDEILIFLFYKSIKSRRKGFEIFKERYIRSTDIKYNSGTINHCHCFDVYIAGGDQIWNDITDYNHGYFLDFVRKDKLKLSYAASMTSIPFSNEKEKALVGLLDSFDYIMVREDRATDYLNGILHKEVFTVVDPVFLLKKEEWDEICDERLIAESYIFAYILGNDNKQYEWIKSFSEIHHLKVVAISNPSGRPLPDNIPNCIEKFDMKSPAEFISLIKYAEIVLTDSFHALAFSIIFDKKFYVFNRFENEKMMVRLNTLLKLVDADNRIISINDSIDMDVRNDRVYYDKKLLNERIRFSKEKLMSILESANSKVLN